MNALPLRFVSAGLIFLLIFPSGWWLSHSGKPYHFALFNIHKLIGFGLFIFLVISIFRVNQATPLSAAEFTACLVAGFFFLVTIVTGGLVSTSAVMPAVVPLSHKILPYLTLLSSVISIYLVLRQR
jgi:hypothetical protein